MEQYHRKKKVLGMKIKGKRPLEKPTSKWKQQKEGRKNKGKSEEKEAEAEDRDIL